MKKFFLLLMILFLSSPCFAQDKVLQGVVEFDWITKTQIQRDENIEQVKNIVFNDDTIFKYDKNEFKSSIADFKKNKNFLNDYDEIKSGKKEDDEKYYCGFYWKKLLVAYGIQYKKDKTQVYYYDAMGTLRWIDKYSKQYPTFPYWVYQYDTKGRLNAVYYYVSDDDQYVYSPKKEFQGRWYKDKLYNKNAKVVLTRSNFD